MDSETKKAISGLERKIENLESKIDEIHREVGARYGSKMSDQVEKLYQDKDKVMQRLSEIERTVTATRKLIEYGDKTIKEIKHAIALIYRNTDELEDNIIGDNRNTS